MKLKETLQNVKENFGIEHFLNKNLVSVLGDYEAFKQKSWNRMVYDNVTMFQEKIVREYQGGSRGMSYRICKGVTYRTGSFKGRPVERSSMDKVGVGSLVITNKHFFFHCPTASVKIPYSKLVGVTPYSDGLEVHKEEAKPKRTVFQGFDAWFAMNVLNQVNNV